MPLAQLAEPWPNMELVHLDTEVSRGPVLQTPVVVLCHFAGCLLSPPALLFSF
uniref:Uncharacterized protein n=1 Tax=Accipiter nisus TaxID=211598 RepID=A0A8B9M4U3_9AVES